MLLEPISGLNPILYGFSQTTNFPKTKGVLVCGKEIILLAGV